MTDTSELCEACFRYGQSSKRSEMFLSCPGCGHMYLSEIEIGIKSIYLEKVPDQFLIKQKEQRKLLDHIKNELGINKNVKTKPFTTIKLNAK